MPALTINGKVYLEFTDKSYPVGTFGFCQTTEKWALAKNLKVKVNDNIIWQDDFSSDLDAYEFTSRCPKTQQPDFAKVVISYIPRVKMVESKSLKLYLGSFRNEGSFHEDCMNTIAKDLIKLMDPKYLEVRGIFSPRGGISIFPFVNYVAEDCPEYKAIATQRQLDVLRDGANRAVRYDI